MQKENASRNETEERASPSNPRSARNRRKNKQADVEVPDLSPPELQLEAVYPVEDPATVGRAVFFFLDNREDFGARMYVVYNKYLGATEEQRIDRV